MTINKRHFLPLTFYLLLLSYCLLLIALFFYSLTQIDLNLTISQNSFLLNTQKFFQNIGYFQRPLSTLIFIILIILTFSFYLLTINLTVNNRLKLRQIVIFIIAATIILLFSYPAFSYDLFNYLFYGRIITHYGLSPYAFRALDFPLDPWIRFMHWTHNTYPYGPFWLVLTTPLSFIGLQKFLPTLILYKMLMTGGYLLSSYSIYKIAQKINISNPLLPLVLFALNPLVIIESLISSHNDIVMIGIALFALYLLLCQKYIPSLILLILSILLKFVTLSLLPVWLLVIYYKIKNKSISYHKVLLVTCALLLVTGLYYLKDNALQPWYFLWIYPFALLLPQKISMFSRYFTFLSFFLLTLYLPYIYFGNWTYLTQLYYLGVVLIPLILTGLTFFFPLHLFSKKNIQ